MKEHMVSSPEQVSEKPTYNPNAVFIDTHQKRSPVDVSQPSLVLVIAVKATNKTKFIRNASAEETVLLA